MLDEHRRFRRGPEPTDVLGRPTTVGMRAATTVLIAGGGEKVLKRLLEALVGPLGESRLMRKALGVLVMAVVLLGACSDGRNAGPEAQPPSTSAPERHRDQLLVGATETPCPPGSPSQHLCQVTPEGNQAVGIGTPSGTVGRLVLPTNATLYSCPEYYAIDVACYLDPDGRWVVATTSSGGGVTSTSVYEPNCRTFLHSNGITSHRCSTPSTEESRANRVTLTPIECPAHFPPTATCQMRSDGEMVFTGGPTDARPR